MTLLDAYKNFMMDKTVENCTVATLTNYRNMLLYFIRFVGLETEVSQLQDPIHVKEYIIFLQDRNVTGKTIHTYLKHIKVFYRWLVVNDHLEFNPISEMRVKYEKKIPQVFTIDEISALAGIDNIRDRLIVVLGLDCGLRKNEIISLKVSDIRTDRIFVRSGKGRKDRIVPISPFTYDLIQCYIKSRAGPSDNLFQKNNNSEPLTYVGLRCVFKRLKDKTGIARLTPHLCRHTYGTYYIHSGGDMKVLQHLMGHSDVETTEIYVHLANMLNVGEYSKYSIINILDKKKDG